jgi:hypothetical protein
MGGGPPGTAAVGKTGEGPAGMGGGALGMGGGPAGPPGTAAVGKTGGAPRGPVVICIVPSESPGLVAGERGVAAVPADASGRSPALGVLSSATFGV